MERWATDLTQVFPALFLLCRLSGLVAKLKVSSVSPTLLQGMLQGPLVILNLTIFQLSNSVKGGFIISLEKVSGCTKPNNVSCSGI